MKKRQKALIIFTLIFIFFLVFQPHWSYRFPLHIDEWHHISEAIRLASYGEYFDVFREGAVNRFSGVEIGFHFFLFILSWVFDLVLTYKFLPALWACLTAGILFYIVYKKTAGNFLMAWLAMIFFASIRSNVNITGLWFFTPLTFAIPFIFLYIYFLTEGIEKQNKRFIIAGLAIMLFLLPTHSISVLFFLPAFIIYLAVNYRYVRFEYKFFLWFLAIPIVGILFLKYTLNIPWNLLAGQLWHLIQFRYGWGVLELQNSFTEVYSIIGYLLAFVGLLFILLGKEIKKYSIYIIWPLSVFVLMILYRMTGVSFLSPFQRNLYYFAIALPFLSAYGLVSLLRWFKYYLNKLIEEKRHTGYVRNFFTFSISLKVEEKYAGFFRRFIVATAVFLSAFLIVIFSFSNYYNLPVNLSLYHVIEEKDYRALTFLRDLPSAKTKVIANPFLSAAIYPVSGHEPVGTVVFYGSREDIERFFFAPDCQTRQEIIDLYQAKYIISPAPLACDYELIYAADNSYVYQVNSR